MKKLLLLAICAGLLAACGGQAQSEASAPEGDNANLLNLYNWADYVDPATLTAFTEKTGITVRSAYYDNNETLEAKMLSGSSGYDLVVPSISNVGRQIQAGAYQPIDKSQIPNYSNLDPQLLKLMEQVDPGNKYAVPYFWGINTLAINTQMVQKALGDKPMPENVWDLVFNPEYTAKLKSCGISYFDSPLEQYPLALNYLGKDPNSTKPEDLQAATDMMRAVRKDIRIFTASTYINDLAAGNLCVAVGYGGDLNIARNRAIEAGNGIDIQVLVPKNGLAVWIDSLMIPKDAHHPANALKYINYTLDPKVAAANGSFVTYAPASQPARELMPEAYRNNESIFPSEEAMANSFVILPKDPHTSRLMTQLYQRLMAIK